MYNIKFIFLVVLGAITACNSNVKDSEDTGFDLGTADVGDDDGGNEGGDDDGTEPENAAPVVSISSPSNGDVLEADTDVSFFAVVSDDTDDPSLLELTWASDRQGELSTSPADSTGATTMTTSSLEGGTHIVTLTAVDRDGNSSSDSVTIRVDGATDGDGGDDGSVLDDIDEDGYTVEEGDCDDEDPWTFPGADEWCDGVDNNCDDIWDDEFADAYESNQNMGTAYDLGEIDGDWLDVGTESLTITELNFNSADDEDWFKWFADDDPGDDPDIAIYAEGDPDLYLIVELYVAEWDTTTPMVTAEGWGEVSIDEDDFEFDGGWWWSDFSWDNIYVRVQTEATWWDEELCEDATYDLTIES